MLRRPLRTPFGGPTTSETPLVQRLVDSLDRVMRERSAPAKPAPKVPLEQDPQTMQASVNSLIDQPQPIDDRINLEHLDYGGTGPSKAQPIYRHNCKPALGTTFRSQKRLELLVRLENAGIPDSQISSMLSISVPRVRQLKRSKDYLRARIKITHGLILDQELALEQIKEQRRDILREMLPPALQVIANCVNTRPTCFAEQRLQVTVAQDILDREGTYAKVSRSEVKPVDHFDWEPTDASASEIVQLMRASIGTGETTVRIAEGRTAKLIEISKAFTAGSNISPEEAIASAKMLEDAEPPEGWAPAPEARNGR